VGGARVRIPLYAAALATGGAFAILFTGDIYVWFNRSSIVWTAGGAFWAMILATLVAALVGSAGRYRFVLLFPAIVVYTQLAVYGWPPLFSLSGWRDLSFSIAADIYEAAGVMYLEPVPYDLHPGLFVVLIPVVMILVTFATSATLYEGSPVISVAVLGLTIGILSTISFEDGAGPFFAVFLVCAVALLLSTRGAESPGRAGVVAGAVVVALVLAVPKMPFANATVSPGFIDWTRIGTGGTSRLDVQADVGDYLTAGREAELIRVQSKEPLLWRGGTLDYFDGVRWSDTTEPETEDGEEVAPGVPTHKVVQRVQVLNAETDVVFGGYRIIQTSLPFASENSDGSWSLEEPLEEDSYYTVVSEVPQPTTYQLQSAGTDYPAEIVQKYLQLPQDTPQIVAQRADEIERDYDPETPYDTARAVERYLVHDGGFIYNLDVSYRRADKAIEEFLSDGGKEGFCTQFATSMALLLRESGVPSRVVYGSTAGQEAENPGEYVVTGGNMHTWVEAYFPGVGWYPFDPTPGFTMPTAMQANAPRSAPSVTAPRDMLPENPTTRGRVQNEQETQQRRREDLDNSASRSGEKGDRAWPFLVLVPVLMLAAVSVAKRALLARGRPEDLYRDLTARLRDALPPGRSAIADSQALTPTERILLLAGAVGVEEEPMKEFARAYSDHLYSAHAGPRPVSSTYRRALRAYERLPRWRRMLGAVNPASLLARMKRDTAAWKRRLAKALSGRIHRSRR
jgi:transglutaminase-like putative cysteine protease